MRKICILGILMFLLLWTGCTTEIDQRQGRPAYGNMYLTAWDVYWDSAEIQLEVDGFDGTLKEVCNFTAYFNSQNRLFVPDNTVHQYDGVSRHYLTITNDRIFPDGSSKLKDTQILWDIFSDEAWMQAHVDEIVALVLENGYDGVDVDYEAIRRDMDLWQLFLSFCDKLYDALDQEGLRMKIVLEPGAPLEALEFPQGPEFVMMCYNLYGPHSGPGPKADIAFLQNMVRKMEHLDGIKHFAFATGGYIWQENGPVRSVTEVKALELLERYDAISIRDEASGVMHFGYQDEEGISSEVWFADGLTLVTWMDTVKEMGQDNVSFWRLGGNHPDSIGLLAEYAK